MVGEPTLVTVKGGQRVAIQATSKVPINCNVVSSETHRALDIYFNLATERSGNHRNADAATLAIICAKFVHKRLYSQVLFSKKTKTNNADWYCDDFPKNIKIQKSVIVQLVRISVCGTDDSGSIPLDRTYS